MNVGRYVVILGAIGGLLAPGLARAAEPVGVLTEIRAGRGEVLVKPVGDPEWRTPQPLLSLYPGDQIRATAGARAVLVLTGGAGALVVSEANSPVTIRAPAEESRGEKLRSLVGGIARFLLGRRPDATYRPLAVRRLQPPPTILSPRGTRVFPGPVRFEWSGPARLRYTVRVLGPQGLVWERTDLPRQPLPYPPAAPPLADGARYVWELQAPGHPVDRTEFEILSPSESARLRQALGLLEAETRSGYPRNTRAVMRAGLFFQEGLYLEARRELAAAIREDSGEATLHLLLGGVYEQIGLPEQAADAFDAARRLAAGRPRG